MAVPIGLFQKHVRYIKDNYTVVGLDELAVALKNNCEFPENGIVLTFDDGLLDNYSAAVPVLEYHSLKAAFFVIGDAVAGGQIVWPHHLYHLLDQLSGRPFTFTWESREFLNCQKLEDAEKLRLIAQLKHAMAQVPGTAAEKILQAMCDQNGVDFQKLLKEPLFMQEKQLHDICKAGHIVGAHSMTHANLGVAESAIVREEIRKSKEVALTFSHTDFVPFAYPYGTRNNFKDTVIESLRENRFDCALTTIEALNGAGADRYALKRIEIGPFNQTELSAHLSGVIGDIKSAVKYITGRN
jgi:peptidoglycan/xylan/chitin deacetylase (PgdA/CDA1 family)